MEDMKVTATGYDLRPAHAAMQHYVDGNLLSGLFRGARRQRFSRCEMHWMGRQGSADTIADRPHIPRLFKYKADYILCCASSIREKATSNLTIRLSSLFRSLRSACAASRRDVVGPNRACG